MLLEGGLLRAGEKLNSREGKQAVFASVKKTPQFFLRQTKLVAAGQPEQKPDRMPVFFRENTEQVKLANRFHGEDALAQPMLKRVPHGSFVLIDAGENILPGRNSLLLTDIHLPRGADLKPLYAANQESSEKGVCLHGITQPDIFRQMRPKILHTLFPCSLFENIQRCRIPVKKVPDILVHIVSLSAFRSIFPRPVTGRASI